ncbi:uncharacterized protein SPAPADRAFT_59453 [Spathaspora passalidarum NRRL Y-27907]|uniref:Cyclin N-terminal domain-containing protein n=1 Tax=Spathaspora passalidarum (strain NRRL Y-27907 / 11-Y1) TaxID=619300 RepID=G3AJY2_SPAPN|nr:uncharacterized protein SPAPADRAFT_59453 [Spathaspora passalidarum NRRL Y-27907]EGW34033.1 hypothetical protein SPAPADRAFT_59453 [Spathaspora passalidarum NRRL Y-27907]
MYQVHYPHHQYPLHGLGTAGHRTSSYLPPQQQPPQPPPQQSAHYNSYYQPQPTHVPSHSLYSYQQVAAPPQQVYNQSVYTPVINHEEEQQPAVNGGINSVLEYNLNQMASFLSWCGFGMLKQSRNPSLEFEQLIVSVLFATRLPKSTIIIALEYMNQRFSSDASITSKVLTEQEIFNHLVVSLVLANKFNDDNTFTNKSWCGATGLDLLKLNKMEKEWLEYVKWSLNVVNFETNILTLEECWKTWLEKYSHAPSASNSPISISSPCSSSPRSQLNSSPITRPHSSYSSIPSSPEYDQKYYALKSSWGQHQQPQQRIPQPSQQRMLPPPPPPPAPVYNYSFQFNDPAVQYVGPPPPSHVGYVGYANPYYMSSC